MIHEEREGGREGGRVVKKQKGEEDSGETERVKARGSKRRQDALPRARGQVSPSLVITHKHTPTHPLLYATRIHSCLFVCLCHTLHTSTHPFAS